MTLDVAILLLVLAVAGIVLVSRLLRKKPRLRKVCLVLLSVIALALALYAAVTIYFVYAVSLQPANP